jgi:transcriptional regulator of acetoin/glycerol metabolism
MGVAVKERMNDFYDQWQNFILGQQGALTIRSEISESWMRCNRAKVDPRNNKPHRHLENVSLMKRLKAKDKLLAIAKPVMENLYNFVQGSGFVVVLTDEHGYILELFGDKAKLDAGMTKYFFRGASWREEEAGTNAIGTSLVIAEPIQVSGAEHYCEKHHCLTCSAAPIFDTDGRIAGILDMSGDSKASHLHTLGMVVAAAEAIMAQLRIYQQNRELVLINQRLTNYFNTMSEGVLIIDRQGIVIELNPSAKAMLGKIDGSGKGIPADRILGCKNQFDGNMIYGCEAFNDLEIMLDAKGGMCHCLASGETITDEKGIVTGKIITLRPIKQVQNLVNRFNGYYATFQFKDILGRSTGLLEAVRVAKLAAETASNVLLQGESGTGKEVFAQSIHNQSTQQAGPFIALNCGAIPRELIGSELFGYEDGAFTGAKRGGKPGKFELASGGTLFLDEIGDMPLEQQAALLRVIQEKKVSRIGSDKMLPVHVRIICATNKNLHDEVARGKFRQDLYYRLNVISITIPPLRNRKDDILPLLNHFLDSLSRSRRCTYYVEPEVLECLERYHWPGNVRELQNVVERASSLAEYGIIKLCHLSPELTSVTPSQSLLHGYRSPAVLVSREQRKQVAEGNERQTIITLLNKYGGNVSKAAKEIGVSRNTFYRKMRIYSISN